GARTPEGYRKLAASSIPGGLRPFPSFSSRSPYDFTRQASLYDHLSRLGRLGRPSLEGQITSNARIGGPGGRQPRRDLRRRGSGDQAGGNANLRAAAGAARDLQAKG